MQLIAASCGGNVFLDCQPHAQSIAGGRSVLFPRVHRTKNPLTNAKMEKNILLPLRACACALAEK